MSIKSVVAERVLTRPRVLAWLSNRPDTDHSQRTTIANAVARRLEHKMPAKCIPLFDKAVLIGALSEANGFNSFIPTCARSYTVDLAKPQKPGRYQRFNVQFEYAIAKFLETLTPFQMGMLTDSNSNWLLSQVVIASHGIAFRPVLTKIAMGLNEPAIAAFRKMEEIHLLSPERLSELSKSANSDVLKAVAERCETTIDTLIDIIAGFRGDTPHPTKAVAAAMENLFSRDGLSLSFDQVARLETSPNPFVQSTVNTLLGKDVRRLVALALSQDPMAKCALIKLREARLLEPEIQEILERYNTALNEPYYAPNKGEPDPRANSLTKILEELLRNGHTPLAVFEALALLEGDIAESAYLIATCGGVDQKTLSALTQSKNKCVLLFIISNKNSDPGTVAAAISRSYQIWSSEIGAKYRGDLAEAGAEAKDVERSKAIAKRAKDVNSRMKGVGVERVLGWIRSAGDHVVQRQIVEVLSDPQLKNDVEILLGNDVDKLTRMVLTSEYLAKSALIKIQEACLLDPEIFAALTMYNDERDVRYLEDILYNERTPVVAVEHLALLGDSAAVSAFDHLGTLGRLDRNTLLALSNSANLAVLEKVICNTGSGPKAIGNAISGYCRIKAAEWSAMTKKKASKKEKQAVARKRHDDIERVIGWIRLRQDSAVQRQILFSLSDIHPKTEKKIRSAVMEEPKGKD
ncbi:MAG: hypothetical protein WC527_05190 [Candidatus Margulisiibacteriota bacterium]